MSEKESKKSSRDYTYEKLALLKPNSTVNVYGVVKFSKPPFRTRGSDYCMVLSLVDPTLHENEKKLKCLLFNKEKELLPYTENGCIVRFHRLKLAYFNGDLQGQSGPGFSWLTFSRDPDGSLEPKASSPNFTITDNDKEMVKELRNWVSTQQEITREECPTLSDIVPQMYFNLYCQVVSTCSIEENVCYLLQVWDGTKPPYPLRQFDIDKEDCIVNNLPSLVKRSTGFVADIAVYDDHYRNCSNIKPGQYVKICNLHAPLFKDAVRSDASDLETLELCVHRGTSYGRGVFVLSEEIPPVKKLSDRLKLVSPSLTPKKNATLQERTRSSENQSPPECSNAKQRRSETNPCEEIVTCDKENQSDNVDRQADQARTKNYSFDSLDGTSRCMLQTKSVVLNHPHVQRTKIVDVLSHSVPYKFRILGHVVGMFPKPREVTDIMRLYCPQCQYMRKVPEFTRRPQTRSSNIEKSIDGLSICKEWSFYNEYYCPECYKETNDDNVTLEYIYTLRFKICDSTGSLIASIWNKDAVTFLNEVSPVEAIQGFDLFRKIQTQLNSLCENEDDPEGNSPWFECCIKTYNVEGESETQYQIFDTCLV